MSYDVVILPIDRLDNTVLIQYAQTDNRERDDIISIFNGNIIYYEVRIPGGFKDSCWMFGVDNEQFETPNADICDLRAIDYTDKLLTIGSSSGIQTETAEYLNRVFSCPLVFVDGRRYGVTDDSTLERVSKTSEGSFIYSILLREAHYLDPTWEYLIHLNLRLTTDRVRKTNRTLRIIS